MIKSTMYHFIQIVIGIFSVVSSLCAQNPVIFTLDNVNADAQTLTVLMENTNPVRAFNLNISGLQVDAITGGTAVDYDFDLSIDGSHGHDIHGNLMGGGTAIPPGIHPLLEISFSPVYELICIYRGHCQGNGNVEFNVELGNCVTIELDPLEGSFFRDIMGGYLDEYLEFIENLGEPVTSYVTVEAADDLDFGDDIGLLSYDGLINYGDCSGETGEILLGADLWLGGPVTIPAYQAIDLCDEGGYQLPGYIPDEPVAIHVWDASEGLEYVMNLTDRDEFNWQTGHIVIGSMEFESVAAQGGDLDGDGLLSITDVIIMIDGILGNSILTSHQESLADTNLDGWVDVLDLVQLIDWILGAEENN